MSSFVNLTGKDCGTEISLPVWSKVAVTAYPDSIGPDCQVTFYTEDSLADIVFAFTDDLMGDYSYIGDASVSFLFYSYIAGVPTLVSARVSVGLGPTRGDQLGTGVVLDKLGSYDIEILRVPCRLSTMHVIDNKHPCL